MTLTGSDVWHIFFGGLQLDFSLGGYIMMFSAFVLACSPWLNARVVRMTFSVLTMVCLVFFAVVTTIDLELFKNWGYHIDTTPLMYLKTPKEAMASTPVWLVLCLVGGMVVFIWGGWWFFRCLLLPGLQYSDRQYGSVPVFLLIGGAMIIPVRGCFNVAPMNSSFVFFHPENIYANQAAVNPLWNFVY